MTQSFRQPEPERRTPAARPCQQSSAAARGAPRAAFGTPCRRPAVGPRPRQMRRKAPFQRPGISNPHSPLGRAGARIPVATPHTNRTAPPGRSISPLPRLCGAASPDLIPPGCAARSAPLGFNPSFPPVAAPPLGPLHRRACGCRLETVTWALVEPRVLETVCAIPTPHFCQHRCVPRSFPGAGGLSPCSATPGRLARDPRPPRTNPSTLVSVCNLLKWCHSVRGGSKRKSPSGGY